jgi:hypothetical protein
MNLAFFERPTLLRPKISTLLRESLAGFPWEASQNNGQIF